MPIECSQLQSNSHMRGPSLHLVFESAHLPFSPLGLGRFCGLLLQSTTHLLRCVPSRLASSLPLFSPSHLPSISGHFSSGHSALQHALTCSPSTSLHVSQQSTTPTHYTAPLNGGHDVRVIPTFTRDCERSLSDRQIDRAANPRNLAPYRD